MKVPSGYFQVDFIAGVPIAHLDTNSNVLYSTQKRLIDSQQGGNRANSSSIVAASVAPASQASSPLVVSVPVVTENVDAAAPGGTLGRKH